MTKNEKVLRTCPKCMMTVDQSGGSGISLDVDTGRPHQCRVQTDDKVLSEIGEVRQEIDNLVYGKEGDWKLATAIKVFDYIDTLRAKLKTAEAENERLRELNRIPVTQDEAMNMLSSLSNQLAEQRKKYRELVREAQIHRAGCGICSVCAALDAIEKGEVKP